VLARFGVECKGARAVCHRWWWNVDDTLRQSDETECSVVQPALTDDSQLRWASGAIADAEADRGGIGTHTSADNLRDAQAQLRRLANTPIVRAARAA
jgi:hypothetical protein